MNRLGMTLKEVYQFIKTYLRKYCEQHCYANVNYIAVQEYYGEEKIIHSVSELNDNTVKELLDYVAGQIVHDYLHKETMGKDYIILIEDVYSDHSVWTLDDIKGIYRTEPVSQHDCAQTFQTFLNQNTVRQGVDLTQIVGQE